MLNDIGEDPANDRSWTLMKGNDFAAKNLKGYFLKLESSLFLHAY